MYMQFLCWSVSPPAGRQAGGWHGFGGVVKGSTGAMTADGVELAGV